MFYSMDKHLHQQKQKIFCHYPDEISSKGLNFEVITVFLVSSIHFSLRPNKRSSYRLLCCANSSLTSNFCNQKLIVIISKCEKFYPIKTLVVAKLSPAMSWAYDTDVFSINSYIATGKLPSQISLIENSLSFLLVTVSFHIIRSKNFVDNFAYVWSEFRLNVDRGTRY